MKRSWSTAPTALGERSARSQRLASVPVEFFLGREAAEAMISEVREDEPMLAEELRTGGGRSSSAELEADFDP